MSKQQFKNLLDNSPKVTDKPLMKIINNQLDMKRGQFTQEELYIVQTKIRNRKAASFDEIPQKYGRQENSMTYCSDTAKPYLTRTQ